MVRVFSTYAPTPVSPAHSTSPSTVSVSLSHSPYRSITLHISPPSLHASLHNPPSLATYLLLLHVHVYPHPCITRYIFPITTRTCISTPLYHSLHLSYYYTYMYIHTPLSLATSFLLLHVHVYLHPCTKRLTGLKSPFFLSSLAHLTMKSLYLSLIIHLSLPCSAPSSGSSRVRIYTNYSHP